MTDDGHDPFKEWLANLADRQARARVVVRVQRMAAGNFGDCKPIAEGMWDLRIDHGPGYRVYYARTGEKLLLILLGGDKRKQQAEIETALEYWKNWNILSAASTAAMSPAVIAAESNATITCWSLVGEKREVGIGGFARWLHHRLVRRQFIRGALNI